jgi:hypothetical protein
LCGLGHHICLVEDDELEETGFGMQSASLCKGLDLFADDVNATVVGCIELRIGECECLESGKWADFEDILFKLSAIDATCNSDDGTGLACTWRAVEEEMGNAVFLNKLFDWVSR